MGILGLLASPIATAAVGITPASHGVSPSGSAVYSVPIRTTPGIGALTPALAVNWAGAGRRGILGVGFDLAGLSQVRRCNRNIAQDGQSAGYRYCLDGARLRSVSGNYGAQNTVYRTEIDQLARITQLGSLPGGYPEWFKVETRDGLVYEYGRTADSRPVTNEYYPTPIHWAVNKIIDRSGNSITFHYDTDAPQSRFRPSYIQYTHTGAASGRYKIGFVYQGSARPDVVDQAASADPVVARNVEDRLLARIELKHDDVVYRQYVFTYETGAGSNSRLKTF